MKVATSLLLITGFLFIAVFGLTALDHGMSHQQSDCIISVMSNAPCPTSINSIVGHHISAIQSLFNVPTSTFIFSIIILVSVSLIGFAYIFRYLLLYNQFITQRSREYKHKFNYPKHRIIAWLSLFEHSPSF